MKKISIICLALALVLMAFGCSTQKPTVEHNDLFKDDFFKDVVEIRDSTCGQVSGDQMESVIAALKALNLATTEEHLQTEKDGETLYGLSAITFVKSDGTELLFTRNHATLTGANSVSYTVTNGENLNEVLDSAFQTALGDEN